MKMTTLEMLNEASKNPGVKYMIADNDDYRGYYYMDGVARNPQGGDFGPSVTWFMQRTWEREVKPLKGSVTLEFVYGKDGASIDPHPPTMYEALREALFGDYMNRDAVANKTFKVTIIAEEVTE